MPTPDTDAVLAPDTAQHTPAARAAVDGPASHGWMSNAADFVRGPAGHSATLGFFGALLITFGGFGAGSVRRNDPLLEAMHLSWLRFGHGLVLSSVFVWIGVIAMITAWVRLGRIVIGRQPGIDVSIAELRAIVGIWIFPLIFAVPMFSRDAYSYLAQGAMVHFDINPYVWGPSKLDSLSPAVLDNVSPVWLNTTAPYGPIFLLIGRAIISITGDNVVAGTIALRLVMLPGLALMVWAIPHLTKHLGGKPTTALWLAVLNPLVLIHLIGGVHNEMLMVGLMAAGIALVLEHHHVAGIVVVAIGVAVKATAGVALPFLVWIWIIHERERRAARNEGDLPHPLLTFAKISALGVAVFAAVFGAATLLTGLKDHQIGWLSALSGSNKIINWLSLPTILAHMTTWVTPLQMGPVLSVTRKLCEIAMVGILVWAWWRFRNSEKEAVFGILVAFVAIVILSPAALPWYYSWPLALAAGFALPTRTLQVLVGLCTWLMLVFQPDGSIGLYNWVHVALATFAAVVAALSLHTVDPLKLRAAHAHTDHHTTPLGGAAAPGAA